MLLPQLKGRWHMAKYKQKKFNVGLTIFLSILFLIVGAFGGLVAAFLQDKNKNPIFESDVVYGDGISFHFMELGNGKTGDSILIQAGTTEILVDGGSRTNSAGTIETYVKDKMQDDVLEYVIVSHADQDHIASFAGDGTNDSLFKRFNVSTIIDFPKTNKNTAVYNRYVSERNSEIEAGAKHYTALECWNNANGATRSIEISKNISLNILYNYYYEHETSDENDYSVCFQIEEGDNKYLFTGDLEESGEEYLVQYNQLSKVKLFKAGHHGSKTSSNDCLLDIIQPEICVVCCCAGSVEYTDNLENTFPTQLFINRISKWTTKVYVTTLATIEQVGVKEGGAIDYDDVSYSSFNGNVVVKSSRGEITVECSNNNTLLKDTDWFKENRTTPSAWLTAAA